VFSITLNRCGARALLAGICTSLLACPPGLRAADDAVHQYVDEITAASITVAVEPLIFARERSDLAANARDYVTLTAIEVNVMGKRSYFWSAYIWSTIDRRDREPIVAPGDELVLVADGRPITLRGDAKTLREHGLGQPPTRAPLRTAVAALYAADLESLGYAGHATQLHVELIHAGSNEAFALWKDGRSALRAFVEDVGGG
jgi:hypothetical protein